MKKQDVISFVWQCQRWKRQKVSAKIKKQIHIPLVADIHFDYRLAIAAIENGADKIRINPGNIGDEKESEQW